MCGLWTCGGARLCREKDERGGRGGSEEGDHTDLTDRHWHPAVKNKKDTDKHSLTLINTDEHTDRCSDDDDDVYTGTET